MNRHLLDDAVLTDIDAHPAMRPIYQRLFKTFIKQAFRPWEHAGYGIKDAWQLRCGNDSLSVFFVTRSVILRENYYTAKEIKTTGGRGCRWHAFCDQRRG